jgi:predicted NAD/FAD-binding protein
VHPKWLTVRTYDRMRIAVIGSGISGVTAAWLLARAHDVTILEAAGRLGGHTNTVRLDLPDETHNVDTGFIVHNRRNYPVFCDLLERWGVATQESEMTFSVSCARSGLEYAGRDLSGVFAQRRNLASPEFWLLLREIVRFGRAGRRVLADQQHDSADARTIGEFLADERFAPVFVDRYLVPLGSAVWSAAPSTFAQFPLVSLLRFLDNHGLLTLVNRVPWRTVTGGAQRYLDAATRSMRAEVRLSSPVHSLRRTNDGVDVITARGSERFDAIVSAVHSDQALRMLSDPSPAEREVLGAIAYERNVAVLHTDERMLPRSTRAWAAWNYQRLESRSTICVTLNREDDIRPERVHARFEYDHPVFDRRALAAQGRWSEINGVRNTWYCGAWWGYGFHEDGAASGMRVAQALGARSIRLVAP